MLQVLFGGLRQLVRDLLSALDAALTPGRPAWKLLVPMVAGLFAAWIVYVPIHELLHVAGCLVTGGSVTELRLAPIYGASLLKRIFPFITPSSEYAGRLSGFSTGGSDLVYLATDAAPYLLTILVGVPLLRALARRGDAARSGPGAGARIWLLGPAVVTAAAPVISLTGDYYEMASILLTKGYALSGVTGLEVLRSDDLFKLIADLQGGEVVLPVAGMRGTAAAASVIGCSLILALWLASCTYKLGMLWERLMARMRPRPS